MVLVAPPLAKERLGRSGRDVKLIPYHRFEITSRLKPADALAAIAAHIEERKWFRWDWPSASNDDRFSGEVTIDGFSITRIMGYRNSFAPVTLGEIHDAGSFSRIVIIMRPYIFVLIFCVFFATVSIASLAASAIPGTLMLVFLYALVMGCFWFEANKQEQVLRRIFQAM